MSPPLWRERSFPHVALPPTICPRPPFHGLAGRSEKLRSLCARVCGSWRENGARPAKRKRPLGVIPSGLSDRGSGPPPHFSEHFQRKVRIISLPQLPQKNRRFLCRRLEVEKGGNAQSISTGRWHKSTAASGVSTSPESSNFRGQGHVRVRDSKCRSHARHKRPSGWRILPHGKTQSPTRCEPGGRYGINGRSHSAIAV